MAKNKKKVFLITLAVLAGIAIISVGVVKAGGNDNKGPLVTTVEIQKEPIESNIISDGIIKTKDQMNIVSSLPYVIKEVLVKEGDKVSKGDTIAVLDTKNLEYEVKTAEINLDIEKEKYEEMVKGIDTFELEKNLENAKINYENAQKKYDASFKLFESGAISKAQLDTDKAALTTAKNNYELAQKRLDEAKTGKDVEAQKRKIELQELNLKLKKEELQKSIIKSPIDGTVVLSNAKVGVPANTLSPMFVIEDTNNLEVEIKLSEYDINKIKIGQKVKIKGEAFKGREFIGNVSYIAPVATVVNTNTGTETSVEVKIDIENPTNELKPGFTADVSINTAKNDEAFVLPYESIYRKNDGTSVVYRVDETDKVIETPVEIGIEGDLKVEIKYEGISEGDKVILNPNEKIKDGMTVNIINKGDGK